MQQTTVQPIHQHGTVACLLAPWLSTDCAVPLSGMTLDSRTVTTGDLFVALQGAVSDGRTFIDKAIASGAAAVLCETLDAASHGCLRLQNNVPIIDVFNLKQHLSAISMRFYFPENNLHSVTAITGTNGKTTIASLLANSYHLLNIKSAQMGTIGNGLYGQLQSSLNTTLDAISVCRELRKYQQQGAQQSIMEVSSHGLMQGRVAAVPFKTGIFTNLTRDHLDYHGTMQAYAEAKERLFNDFPLQHKIINGDDATGKIWLARHHDAVAYGFEVNSDSSQRYFKITDVDYIAQGVHFKFDSSWGQGVINAPFYGAFNVLNLAAICCALLCNEISLSDVQSTMTQLAVVPGRMEQYFFAKQQATFIVDYAHTPDALKNALMALQAHKKKGRVIAMFGCGGDRDKGKRPEMAKAAEQGADKVIIVDDNPRNENASAIIEDIKQGLSAPQQTQVIHDRAEAIAHLLATAMPNDIILVAGKGHEDYQIFGNEKVHYSDRECLSALLDANA